MIKENINDLVAFLAVAKERSFTKAAAKMGVSQSALSHTIRELEERLGVRLLMRTTRSVAPTDAGERLALSLSPRFEEIEEALASIRDLRHKPAGTIRISATDHAAETIIWPKLQPFLRQYPDIYIEVACDHSLIDIVEQGFEAGVRLGEQVAKDMIAVRIGADMRMAIVGSPSYFENHEKPAHPQHLVHHNCIAMRLPTHGGLLTWEFEKGDEKLNVRVEGQVISNRTNHILNAALNGLGVGYIPEDLAYPYIEQGELMRVLDDWCRPFDGYHLYYPSRRQASPAFALLVDYLRYK